MSLPEQGQRRRTKACAECRQQKLRCDAQMSHPGQCSRCKRMDLPCVMSNAYKRTKRLTRVEMQREIQRLETRLSANSPQSSATRDLGQPINQTIQVDTTPSPIPEACPRAIENRLSDHHEGPEPCSEGVSLDGFVLPTDKIDALFSLYFTRCNPCLPILDVISSEHSYEQSPFLFWAIVYVASRRHEDDSLLPRLVPRVVDLAFKAISSWPSFRPVAIPIIQGLLLLSAWPVPVETRGKDISQLFSCTALQLAMKNGLHISRNGQEFSRTALEPPKNEPANCTRVWAYCTIVSQSINLGDGLPPLVGLDSFDYNRMHQNFWLFLDPCLKLRLKLHKVQTDAVREIAQSGFLGRCSADETKMLNTLILLYDERLLGLIDRPLDENEKVAFDSVRLHIQVFRFFGDSASIEKPGFVRLFSLACDVLENLAQLESQYGSVVHGPLFNSWIIVLAAFAILRLLRSELRQYLDYPRGERAYFTAIDLFRKMSVDRNDLQARGIVIMAQLWTSQSIFRQNNGTTDSLCLRIRNRLAMGVVFDCFWWWRAEIQGQTNPYAGLPHENDSTAISYGGLGIPGPPSVLEENLMAPLEQDMSANAGFTADTIPDWDWATCFEMPVDSYISNGLI